MYCVSIPETGPCVWVSAALAKAAIIDRDRVLKRVRFTG
jgi:hypothetical protein